MSVKLFPTSGESVWSGLAVFGTMQMGSHLLLNASLAVNFWCQVSWSQQEIRSLPISRLSPENESILLRAAMRLSSISSGEAGEAERSRVGSTKRGQMLCHPLHPHTRVVCAQGFMSAPVTQVVCAVLGNGLVKRTAGHDISNHVSWLPPVSFVSPSFLNVSLTSTSPFHGLMSLAHP